MKGSFLLEDWFLAAKNNNLEKIQEIASQALVDIDVEKNKGWNALRMAIYNDALEVADYLLKKKSSLTLLDSQGETILHDAARIGKGLPCILPYCKKVDIVNFYGTSPIMRASTIEKVQAFLDRKANINRRNQVGGSWLLWNISDRKNELLKFGTNLSLIWDDGCTQALDRLKKELNGRVTYEDYRKSVEESIYWSEQIYSNALREKLSLSIPKAIQKKDKPKL